MSDRSGQLKGVLARVFGSGEDPLGWGVSLWRVGPTQYRLHAILPLFVLGELIWSIPENRLGLPFVAMLLAAMGVCLSIMTISAAWARRRTRSEAPEQVVIWPLGELSASLPRPGDLTSGIATLVSLLVVMLACLAGLLIGSRAVETPDVASAFNPLDPGLALLTMPPRLLPLWSIYSVSAALLAANLIPAMPTATGRMLAAVLARSRGAPRATVAVGSLGRWLGAALAVLGLMTGAILVLALGLGLGLVSHAARQRARFLDIPHAPEMIDDAAAPPPSPEQIDRILSKISQDGIESLSSQERAMLERASHTTSAGADR